MCTARSSFGARNANSYGRASKTRLNLGFSSAPEARKADSGDDCVNGVFAGLRARAAPAAEKQSAEIGNADSGPFLRCSSAAWRWGFAAKGLWIVAYKPWIALGRGPPAIRPLWLFGP